MKKTILITSWTGYIWSHWVVTFEKYNFDWVVHFAGLKAVGESCEKAELYFDNNINWSNVLFWLMKKFGVKNYSFL